MVFQDFSQSGKLTVHVEGVENTKGRVEIGLYNKSQGFADYDKRFKGFSLKASKYGVKCTFNNLPPGTYACAVFHDENGNKKIDKNWFGIPTEKYGFSLNKFGALGPPKFKLVSFTINNNQSKSITINIK